MSSAEVDVAKVEGAGGGVKRRRRSVDAAERARWVALFERSGLGVREFCRTQGLAQSSLSAWRRGRGLAARAAGRGLVKVAVTGAGALPTQTASSARVLIRLTGGQQIEAAQGMDVAWLAALARGLDACSG